jgi:hypothetical protein
MGHGLELGIHLKVEEGKTLARSFCQGDKSGMGQERRIERSSVT